MNFIDLLRQFKIYLRNILDFSGEKENEQDTIESIRKGIDFKGANLWVLIFAIFIASLGLNTNSTAVIIGAMLISPLMGPIMGIGLGLGIDDFELIKKSFRNLAIATIFSILTSTLYFLISPLNEARSELLARTTPTIYDVLIAFFGGMAGIVAVSSKIKGNVIPGVAIATALMPPLCTAGFGLASGNLTYFFGAFYLYTINSVFIAAATTLGVKLMNFHKKTFVDKERERRVKQIVFTIIFITIVPSIYITYNMIKTNIFETSITRFINTEFNFPNTLVVNHKIQNNGDKKVINVSLVGKELSEETIIDLRQRMSHHRLDGTELIISQGFGKEKRNAGNDELNNLVLQDFYKTSREKATLQENEINALRKKLEKFEAYDTLGKQIAPEVGILFPYIKDIAIAKIIRNQISENQTDTLTVVILSYRHTPATVDENRFKEWITTRVGVKNIKLIRE